MQKIAINKIKQIKKKLLIPDNISFNHRKSSNKRNYRSKFIINIHRQFKNLVKQKKHKIDLKILNMMKSKINKI